MVRCCVRDPCVYCSVRRAGTLSVQSTGPDQRLTEDAQEGKVQKLLLGHDNAVLGEDATEDHHVHGRLMVADDNGWVSIQVLLSDNLVGDATGLGRQEGEEARDDVVDRITLVENSTDDRDEASGHRHDHCRQENHNALCQELGLLWQGSEDIRKDKEDYRRNGHCDRHCGN